MTLSARPGGWLWPDSDKHLWAVAHDLTMLEMASTHVTGRRTVIQAGGACGTFPHWLCERFETVYTFECDPQNFTCLAANCQEPNIIKFQCALGADTRRISLEREKADNSGTTFVASGRGAFQMAGDSLEIADVDLIQLDCEGAEYAALYGLRQTIAKWHPIIIIEQKHSIRYGVQPQTVVDMLSLWGYEQVGKYGKDLIFRRIG